MWPDDRSCTHQNVQDATTTGVLSISEIDNAIETLQKLKLGLLSSLPRIHSVWGNVNNPMSWRLVQKVADGFVKYRTFTTGSISLPSYTTWSNDVNRLMLTDITALVKKD